MQRRRRISLTQTDRTTTAGLELLGLLQEIADDGMMTPDEVARRGEWLQANTAADLAAREYLAGIIVEVQRDGRITDDELRFVYDGVLRVLPTDLRDLATLRRRERRRAIAVQTAEARAAEQAARREQRERDRILERADFMVVGIRHKEERREACDALDEGDRVWLVREPDNVHDRNAIMVKNDEGDELGYVPREVAADLASILDDSARQDAIVKKLIETSRGWVIPVVLVKLYSREAALGYFRDDPAPRSVLSPHHVQALTGGSTSTGSTVPSRPSALGPTSITRTPWALLGLLAITIVLAWLTVSFALQALN